MAKRNATAPARLVAVAANTAVQAAAASAHAAIIRCGASRSGRLNPVEVTAPTTNPSWTEAVSHTAAVALIDHSTRRAGTTAEAENQTVRLSTWTKAINAR